MKENVEQRKQAKSRLGNIEIIAICLCLQGDCQLAPDGMLTCTATSAVRCKCRRTDSHLNLPLRAKGPHLAVFGDVPGQVPGGDGHAQVSSYATLTSSGA